MPDGLVVDPHAVIAHVRELGFQFELTRDGFHVVNPKSDAGLDEAMVALLRAIYPVVRHCLVQELVAAGGSICMECGVPIVDWHSVAPYVCPSCQGGALPFSRVVTMLGRLTGMPAWSLN